MPSRIDYFAVPAPAGHGRGIGVARATCLVAVILALAACASRQPRAPQQAAPQQAASEQHTAQQTAAKPAAPVAAKSSQSRIAVLGPGNPADQKARIEQELAKDSRDALAPADVGYYMDVLQGRLKQMAGNRIAIGRHANHIVLDFVSRLDFDPGSAQLGPAIRDALAPLLSVLTEYQMTLICMTLRAEDPGPSSNQDLGAKRALALAHYLAASGILARRIVIAGAGSDPAPAVVAAAESPSHLSLELEPIVLDLGSQQ